MITNLHPKGQIMSECPVKTYGVPELCAWPIQPGLFWIQTTNRECAEKLERRSDMRRVKMDGVTSFLRTFETRGTWRKLQRLIDRFLRYTPDQFSDDFAPQNASKKPESVRTADCDSDAIKGQRKAA